MRSLSLLVDWSLPMFDRGIVARDPALCQFNRHFNRHSQMPPPPAYVAVVAIFSSGLPDP